VYTYLPDKFRINLPAGFVFYLKLLLKCGVEVEFSKEIQQNLSTKDLEGLFNIL